jgi:hypothetical protein
VDFHGTVRDALPDIGALEYGPLLLLKLFIPLVYARH